MALLMLGAILVDTRRLTEAVTVNRQAIDILRAEGQPRAADLALTHLQKALHLLNEPG